MSTIVRLATATLLAGAITTVPAAAAVTLRITASNDVAFENAGGSLQSYYSLPAPVAPSASVLPPLERAVGQIRMGGQRRALHLPTAAGPGAVTGTPVADGGTGVTQALTNANPYASATTDFSNNVAVPFSIARLGNVVTYTVGSNVLTGNARASMLDINAFEFRIRSNPTSVANPANAILISNIVFKDSITASQSLPDFSAANGAVNIGLWDGIVGDFTLSGKYTVTWTGTRPNNSALASQVKLLAVPILPTGGVPEPASWAMLIAGFGLTGAAMRRRRAIIA